MRAFYLSIVLFLLMLGVIASSMVMNRHVCGRMQEALEGVGEEPTAEALARLEELQAFWHGWRDLVRLTVNQTVWRAVNDATTAQNLPYYSFYSGSSLHAMCTNGVW